MAIAPSRYLIHYLTAAAFKLSSKRALWQTKNFSHLAQFFEMYSNITVLNFKLKAYIILDPFYN
jgi:hypothetical protein